MKTLIPSLVVLFFLFTSCNSKKTDSAEEDSIKTTEKSAEEIAVLGKKTMENKCYLCHNPKASKNNRVGPPMVEIKAKYMEEFDSKEAFVNAIWNFTQKPTEEKAKLRGAVKRFGLMPYQKYQQENIEALASYIYDYQIEEPEWFAAHWENQYGEKFQQKGKDFQAAQDNQQSVSEIGMNYAKSTKAELGKNLMGAIQKKGVLHALEFCNVQAMPLTDSMATVHNTKIKRVSDKNINPGNKANSKEIEYINNFKEMVSSGAEPQPIIDETDKKVDFYYPITTNDMCLKCHGTVGKELKRETYDKILELYPDDKAIGYDVNEVRGIWSISFEK
ncbi:MAG: Tll0287-like domain-containing protein [Bacteroidota bacterium]